MNQRKIMDPNALKKLNDIISSTYYAESLKKKMDDVYDRLFNKSLLVDRQFFIQKYNIESILESRNWEKYEELKVILLKNLNEDD